MSDNESMVAELRAQIRELQDLIDSPIWKQYTALIESQCTGRINTMILTPLTGLDETLAQEYAKGEVAGMRLALAVLPQLIEDTTAEINRVEPEDE